MKLIMSLLVMFSFKATFAQMHGTRTHKNNKTGEIITVSYRENIGQKIKNIVFEPHYYTKKIIVKDSLGQLKWHFKLKSHAFGCERAIGSNYYKFVLYNSDNTRTMMKTRRIADWRRTTIKCRHNVSRVKIDSLKKHTAETALSSAFNIW